METCENDRNFVHTFVDSMDCNSCQSPVGNGGWCDTDDCPGHTYFKTEDEVTDSSWRKDHSMSCPCNGKGKN